MFEKGWAVLLGLMRLCGLVYVSLLLFMGLILLLKIFVVSNCLRIGNSDRKLTQALSWVEIVSFERVDL